MAPPSSFPSISSSSSSAAAPAPAPPSSLSSAAQLVEKTAADLHIRSEVESTIRSILTDIELGHALRSHLSHHQSISQLRHDLRAAQRSLDEIHALNENRARRNIRLADGLVGELFTLSVKLNELETWKVHNEDKVRKYDDMVHKLAQAEERSRRAERRRGAAGAATEDKEEENDQDIDHEILDRGKKDVENEARKDDDQHEGEEDVSGRTIKEGNEETAAAQISHAPLMSSELGQISEVDTLTEEGSSVPPSSTIAPTADTGSVFKDDEDGEANGPNLPDLEEETLMTIFAYLEAFDILSMAQVNITLYSKIDSLFGLGGAGIGEEEEEESASQEQQVTEGEIKGPGGKTTSSETAISGGSAEAVQQKQQTSSTDAVTTRPSSATPGVKSAAGGDVAGIAAPAAGAAKKATTSPSSPVRASSTSAAATTSTTTSTTRTTSTRPGGGGGGGLPNVFSLLQKRDGASMTSPPPAARGTSRHVKSRSEGSSGGGSSTSSTLHSDKHAPLINASVVNSMASKLTPAEMTAIISMTDKIRTKDKELMRLQQEKEDLAATLEGTEAVKEFLIVKVRDAERALKKSREESVKVTQQIASDQEVIAFLDGRVQELERTVKALEEEKKTAVEELQRVRSRTEKKVRVLSDMLQFEREQRVDTEREWKQAKKVLIKEVKSCRAQIVALQAERDGCQEQNMKLREALLASTGGNGINPRDDR